MIAWGRFVLYDGEMTNLVKLYAKAKKFNVESKRKFKKNIPFISRENELKVWHMITKKVEDNLAAFPTTYKEDMKMLEQDDEHGFLNGNERNCVLFRAGEKKVLSRLHLTCIMMLEAFEMDMEDAFDLANATDALHGLRYYMSVVFKEIEQEKK